MPYQVFGLRVGALALTMAWIRSAMTRSGFAISAILASTSLSPSTLPERARRRSLRVSLIAARSSADNNASPLPAVRRTDVCVAFFLLMVFLLKAGHLGARHTVSPITRLSPWRTRVGESAILGDEAAIGSEFRTCAGGE